MAGLVPVIHEERFLALLEMTSSDRVIHDLTLDPKE
jgi:hypothetical protein